MKILTLAAAALIISTAASAQTYLPRITAPNDGGFVRSPVTLKLDVKSYGGPAFLVDRSQACSPAGQCYAQRPEINVPGVGHCHVYVETDGRPGVTSAFSAACPLVAANKVEFVLDLPRGRHCAWVDLTENDHRSLVKPGPQALPPVDKVCFRVTSSALPSLPPLPSLPDLPPLNPFAVQRGN